MDFRPYAKYVNLADMLILQYPPLQKRIALPCWPDYEKGWRYGQPFSDDRNAEPIPPARLAGDSSMYFVKTAELEKAAHAFCSKELL